MFEPAENENTTHSTGTNPETQGTGGYSGETDRVNGEYHYKNGYTQKIYSDAHYVPEGENTVPPRYYTPPEKPVKEPKPPRQKKNHACASALCARCLAA